MDTNLSDWADRTHAQGGTVVVAHFPNPNGEPAVLVSTGRADAVEMLAQSDDALLEYYRYLNTGYRLPLVGGTDKCPTVCRSASTAATRSWPTTRSSPTTAGAARSAPAAASCPVDRCSARPSTDVNPVTPSSCRAPAPAPWTPRSRASSRPAACRSSRAR